MSERTCDLCGATFTPDADHRAPHCMACVVKLATAKLEQAITISQLSGGKYD